jgi:hypothetical protein
MAAADVAKDPTAIKKNAVLIIVFLPTPLYCSTIDRYDHPFATKKPSGCLKARILAPSGSGASVTVVATD